MTYITYDIRHTTVILMTLWVSKEALGPQEHSTPSQTASKIVYSWSKLKNAWTKFSFVFLKISFVYFKSKEGMEKRICFENILMFCNK